MAIHAANPEESRSWRIDSRKLAIWFQLGMLRDAKHVFASRRTLPKYPVPHEVLEHDENANHEKPDSNVLAIPSEDFHPTRSRPTVTSFSYDGSD